MHFASKLLAFLTQPLNGVALLLLAALLYAPRHRQRAQNFVLAAAILLLPIGWLPLSDMLLRQLEGRYPEIAPQAQLPQFAGVVILGGAMQSGRISQDHVQPLLNASATRMTAALALHLHNPQLRLVFSGGEGDLFDVGPNESQRAQAFFSSMGLGGDAVLYENQSRNTAENAVRSAQLPGVDIHKPWLLLTSAWHMPRAMACFEKAGWNVRAYPVDFRSAHSTPLYRFSLVSGAQTWELVLHEWLGLVAYRLSARA